jgi:CRISPR-associated endonuclease/helicase Cas3
MPPFIVWPWAKLAYDKDKAITDALPLTEHALDVAACGWALLTAGAWRRALEATAGRALTELDLVRIVVLMALHDIGKANWGFQARWHSKAERIGHEPQVAPLWLDKGLRGGTGADDFRDAIIRFGAQKHLAALMAHHGRPREEFGGPPPTGGLNRSWEKHSRFWKPKDGYDPLAAAAALIAQIRERYPQAWEEGPKLPDNSRFVALFAGLVTLADWLGSDTTLFPVEGPYGDEREALRGERAQQAVTGRGLTPLDTPPASFDAAFGFPPRGVQGEADAADLGPVALIEAETGSGKTEAALWRWLSLRARGEVDGLFFALPTRTAAVQLRRRVQDMADRVFGEGAIEVVLAVPGYLEAGYATGQALPGFEVRWDDGGSDARWAAERSNRYLAARVAVGTIDQALLGALRVKHSPFRAAALARSLLVVDEVHASDAYMGAVLRQLLSNHTAAGGHAVLLSATLGAEARAQLLGQARPTLEEAAAVPYPALAGSDAAPRQASAEGTRAKTVRFETLDEIGNPEAIAARAIEAARQGASVLVVRNSVADAVAVAQAVEAAKPDLAFRVNGIATLHHGRFAPTDRRLLDQAVEEAFGKQRTAAGRILIGTQTLEQSLDLDADLLITDLAPIDVLLQRIGRLHRHERHDRGAFAEARAIVLRPADLTPLLERAAHGLGPMADGRGVYPNLLQLEATLRVIAATPEVTIPDDNRRLVEGALHPEVIGALAVELGTAWRNHAAACATLAFADASTGRTLSLDLSTEFRDLIFPDISEDVATRLGAKDLLVDFAEPLPGPFGEVVQRLRIPHWMARGIGPDDAPELLANDDKGARFRLGARSYTYGRWGLTPD